MRQLSFLAAASLGAFTGCNSTTSPSASSTQHQQAIPGTHLLVTLPPGFRVSSAFTGLENPDGSKLLVMDIEPNNYERHASEFTREMLEAGGAKVLDFQQTTISGYPARYASIITSDGELTQTYMYGDTTFAVLVMGTVGPGHEADTLRMKQTILTSRYDKKLKTDALANAPFRLDTRQSRFHLTKVAGGMFVFTTGGPDSKGANDPGLVISTVPTEDNVNIDGLKTLLMESLERNGWTEISLHNEATFQLDGHPAYEATIHGSMRGKQGAFYQMLVLGPQTSLIVQGIAPTDSTAPDPALLQELKALAHTIKLK